MKFLASIAAAMGISVGLCVLATLFRVKDYSMGSILAISIGVVALWRLAQVQSALRVFAGGGEPERETVVTHVNMDGGTIVLRRPVATCESHRGHTPETTPPEPRKGWLPNPDNQRGPISDVRSEISDQGLPPRPSDVLSANSAYGLVREGGGGA